jgi:hypothetical protein
MIAETKHLESFGHKKRIASSVTRFAHVVEMLAAINLDDQLRGM